MNASTLANLGAGFSNVPMGSQAMFRAALSAIAHPGRVTEISHDAQAPLGGHVASAGLLLALLDADCRVWISPVLARSGAEQWLRFHTGCSVVTDLQAAQFSWIATGDDMPALATLPAGSDNSPEQSMTCVVDVAHLSNSGSNANCLRLTGPGIKDCTWLDVEGVTHDFVEQWQENHASFPRGVDIYLATSKHIVGLPRTTSISALADTER